jgi:hypothetical protein
MLFPLSLKCTTSLPKGAFLAFSKLKTFMAGSTDGFDVLRPKPKQIIPVIAQVV